MHSCSCLSVYLSLVSITPSTVILKCSGQFLKNEIVKENADLKANDWVDNKHEPTGHLSKKTDVLFKILFNLSCF